MLKSFSYRVVNHFMYLLTVRTFLVVEQIPSIGLCKGLTQISLIFVL